MLSTGNPLGRRAGDESEGQGRRHSLWQGPADSGPAPCRSGTASPAGRRARHQHRGPLPAHLGWPGLPPLLAATPAHSGPGSARPCPGPAPWLPHARAAERAAGPGSSGSSGCRRWGPLPGHLTSGTDAFLQALHHPSSLSCPLPPVCRSQACGGPNLCFTGRHLEAASEHCRAGIDLRAEPPPSRSPES